jgi:uncharacterized protein YfaS (alpha-2-macroglobulin family)
MTFRPTLLSLALGLLAAVPAAAQIVPAPSSLRVVNAGPTGEVAAIEEGTEIRVTFSEPMVPLTQASAARPPFFHVTPAIAGTFRWSGTNILILTPARRLPFATKYDVSIDAGTAAVSGRRLASAYTFSFTTPTVRLLSTNWYRPGNRYDQNPIVILQFNQPVRPENVIAHIRATFVSHPFVSPVVPQAVQDRLSSVDPAAMQAFTAKVQAVRAAAQASTPLSIALATNWDKSRFPQAPDMVAVQVSTAVPPESWFAVQADGRVPSLGGSATSGRTQSYTVKVERAFFAEEFRCTTGCNPDGRNPIRFRDGVNARVFAAALKATDVTDARSEHAMQKGEPRKRESWEQDDSNELTVEDAGFTAQPPASTWFAMLSPDLKAVDGQTLGYTWGGLVENWHQTAFTSFGDGHGVWETGGGSLLPFYARNFRNVKQWAKPIEPQDLMATLVRLQPDFHLAPDLAPVDRRLTATPDKVLSHGLDLSAALKPNGTGLVWAAVEEGSPIAKSRSATKRDGGPLTRATVVQVTNLGITVKDSPQNTLVFVTRLDNGAPVPGAKVSIVRVDGEAQWTGTTGTDGVAIAPDTRLRNPRKWFEFSFIVTAEKDGDLAYVGSDWNEGIIPWEFGMPLNLAEADPLLVGSVFTDRGVYKLGEDVHLKAILRSNTASGVKPLADGTSVQISVRDSRDKVVDDRIVKVNAWSSAEWTMTVPPEGALGSYSIRATLGDKKTPAEVSAEPNREGDEEFDVSVAVNGSFLVAAYRRPDFRVDVTLAGATKIAGDPLSGIVNGRYLFGAPMKERATHWTLTRTPYFEAPQAIVDKFPEERWTFVGYPWEGSEISHLNPEQVAADDGQLTPDGKLSLDLDTTAAAGIPYSYVLEGDVEDVSRQHIANRASLIVHPAPWYIGIRNSPLFNSQSEGLKTELVAVGLDGKPVAGIKIDVTLTQVQWTSVRRAEGNGFYTWETERKEVPAGEWHLTSATDPVPLTAPLPAGGYYILQARADADNQRFAITREPFYALGSGYTAWQRYDHNRIDLVADKKTYKPGETAKIMIESPWEQATALVTMEREGVRTHRQFALTSTQQSIDVPINDGDIPNVYVSVLLVKGRTVQSPARAAGERGDAATRAGSEAGNGGGAPPSDGNDDPSDPGKPAFRLGYLQLNVEDASKRLAVAVKANKEEYRPANNASVVVDVKDAQQRGAPSEVTLWAVDYGVLSLTAYQTPDVLDSVYVKKALEVMTEDNRQRIISRRVLTPKGDGDGGGGGADSLASSVRSDFRVLAFWLGSVTTDSKGHASTNVKLPESLTTYRIMAVAADKGSRFGSSATEIRINKPVTLKSTFPRFLAVGDKASFGAVVTSQLKTAGTATVTIESLDPQLMDFADKTPQHVPVVAGGSVEVRFDAAGRAVGHARVRMTVKIGNESDAFQDIVPVEVLASPETVSAVGEADESKPTAAEKIVLPPGAVSTFGGLHVDLASTALVGLGEGARYLVEYPYGCAEQRGSRALAMLLSADLGDAFRLPGIEPAKLKGTVQSALNELERFQCPTGGFAYWPGECSSTSPYLTAYLLHVFKVAKDLKYDVDSGMTERAYGYLDAQLATPPPTNEGWWPSYTGWQAFAVKVLVEGGKNADSHVTRLYGYRERMPVFALAYLYDALVAKGEGSGDRAADLRRRIGNAILPEAATAHVEELNDPYLMWYWNSNVRSTAIALNTLVKSAPPDGTAGSGDVASFRAMVTWLLRARDKDGRWGNTQENALALESLVNYYRRFESVVPDFAASVKMGGSQIASAAFKGRSTAASATDVPMSKLQATPAGTEQPLTFARTGNGTLFYAARLRYAVDDLFQSGLDQGMAIERSYAPYVEGGTPPAATTTFTAGDLIRVTLTLRLTKERRFVAVTDPLPAGFEPVESWFASTAASLSRDQDAQNRGDEQLNWFDWWAHGGFDHVERHDDRVLLFATRLDEGTHTFSYIVRATTAGSYRTAPAHAEEMYEPEVFGRTATAVIDIKK